VKIMPIPPIPYHEDGTIDWDKVNSIKVDLLQQSVEAARSLDAETRTMYKAAAAANLDAIEACCRARAQDPRASRKPADLLPVLDFGGWPESPSVQAANKRAKKARRAFAEALGERRRALRVLAQCEHEAAAFSRSVEFAQARIERCAAGSDVLRKLAKELHAAAYTACVKQAVEIAQKKGHTTHSILCRLDRDGILLPNNTLLQFLGLHPLVWQSYDSIWSWRALSRGRKR